MNAMGWVGLVVLVAVCGPGTTAGAQDAPVLEEVLSAPAAEAAPTGPEWRVFSSSTTSVSLIDEGSLETVGDEVHVKVARVPKVAEPGDYSHVLDLFGVRCDAKQTHLISSAEAYEDGELTEAFDAGEPWADVQPDSFDEGVLEIGCGLARATGDPFDSVRAYVDAGRP
jgi:hypothetical protein